MFEERIMMRRYLCIALLAALPLTASVAQVVESAPSQSQEDAEVSNLEYYAWETGSTVLPILVLCLGLFFVIRKSIARNRPYIQRSQQHMDRMEAKYDRIIHLLEELAKRQE